MQTHIRFNAGVPPEYFRHAARAQIAHYDTATMVNGTVTAVSPVSFPSGDHHDETDDPAAFYPTLFSVDAHFPSHHPTHQTLHARKIVLATGLRDILPSTPGVRDAWGKGIFWCPWCDGHEYANQPLGILGPLRKIPGMVREIRSLNRDVVALVNGTDTPAERAAMDAAEPRWEAYLASQNVSVDNRPISRVVRLVGDEEAFAEEEWRRYDAMGVPSVAHRDLFRVEFVGGDGEEEYVERAAFLASFPTEQASSVGSDMGVELLGGRLAVNHGLGLMTNVPGVYAVGDANSDNVTNIPHALFSGKRAAVFLHGKSRRFSMPPPFTWLPLHARSSILTYVRDCAVDSGTREGERTDGDVTRQSIKSQNRKETCQDAGEVRRDGCMASCGRDV